MSQNSHDKLFKATFSKIEHARGFLKEAIPNEISSEVDWTLLSIKPGSFVSHELREMYSDLLFETHIGKKKCLFYLLAEHKSKNDPWVMLQLLQYQLSIWNRWRQENPKSRGLPPIIPLVVSHAKSVWKVSNRFSDLFQVDDDLKITIEPYLLSFKCIVQDLTKKETQQIKEWTQLSSFARLVLFLLKEIWGNANLLKMFSSWADILKEIEDLPDAKRQFSVMFSYIYQVKKLLLRRRKCC